ncbi:MAG: cation:proton antiporter, partial [Thermoleophilia bacterium]|nr:cation:proton antiporter [Thermoleophilia bacterium]
DSLSLLFSREGGEIGSQAILLGGFVVVTGAIGLAVAGAERLRALSQVLFRLQDTTAQIRIRGAFLLLIVFAFVADRLGLETILGAFMAGALLTLLDRDRQMTHPNFRLKLESAGLGIFIPVFFVVSGIRFDLDALTSSAGALARVPVFLLALLAVRGLPALLYRSEIGSRRSTVAALLQATSLPFIVVATQIGLELGTIDAQTAAALVCAGILSILLFPLGALTLLRRGSVAAVEP